MSSLASILVTRGYLQALYTGNMVPPLLSSWCPSLTLFSSGTRGLSPNTIHLPLSNPSSAFYHFTFVPSHMMHKLSLRRSSPIPHVASSPGGDPWHHDIMAYLGGINTGFAVLAAFRLYALYHSTTTLATAEVKSLDVLALTVLGVANASQAVLNFGLSPRSGRWIMGKGWDRITVLDAAFAVLDGSVVVARLMGY